MYFHFYEYEFPQSNGWIYKVSFIFQTYIINGVNQLGHKEYDFVMLFLLCAVN